MTGGDREQSQREAAGSPGPALSCTAEPPRPSLIPRSDFRFPFSSQRHLSFVSRHQESGDVIFLSLQSEPYEEIAEATIGTLEFRNKTEGNEAEKSGISKEGKINRCGI